MPSEILKQAKVSVHVWEECCWFVPKPCVLGMLIFALQIQGGLAFMPYSSRTEQARSRCAPQEAGETPRERLAFGKPHL